VAKSTIQDLADYGQSVWLDYISRSLLESGKLQEFINRGLRGMTSNPSIFNQAIGSSRDYDERIRGLKGQARTIFDIYDALTIGDIQQAAAMFRPVYEKTSGQDGYVSLEINPQLARDSEASIKEGRRLFEAVGAPNVMIKVPATDQGYTVITELIASGIPVNATLIFSLEQYRCTARAYFEGLRRMAERGGDISSVRSVASVFISRVDSRVDAMLNQRLEQGRLSPQEAEGLMGRAAVANAGRIFEAFQQLHDEPIFADLAGQGASVQRVLWASTSTKNPRYSDIKYVQELIAAPTVNTLPEKTLLAFLDHGEVISAEDRIKDYAGVLRDLDANGIAIDEVCACLLEEGLEAFERAFDELFQSLERKAREVSVV